MKRRVVLYFLIMTLIFAVLPVSVSAEGESADLDWDSIISSFLAENRCREDSVALGYYNTVTGEEHFYRGDEYMETGSTYKIPLNMVYAEKVYKGEMDFDTTIGIHEYSYLQRQTIINSNNEYATLLWQNIGGYDEYGNYRVFRTAIAPYMGVDPDNVDPLYYENRFFTAEQVMHCLKTLYSQPERFPGVIDCMLLAEQDNYFCYHPQDYPVAHKYGYIFENGCLYICDCGICYTDDPILLVMFTANVRHPNSMLADYCTLMCDYAESTRQARLSQAEALKDVSVPVPEKTVSSQEPVSVSPDKVSSADQEIIKENCPVMPIIIISLIFIAAVLAVIVAACRKKIKPVSGFLSVLLATAALTLCVIGALKGTIFTKTEGDPRDTVIGFFDSIASGNYDLAYSYLADYSDLGLEIKAGNDTAVNLIDALHSSYGYELIDDCVTDGLKASQKVRIRYLDYTKMSADLQQNTNDCIRAMVDRLSRKEIYDEAGEYLPEFIDRAYAEAVGIALSHIEDYYSYRPVKIDLIYRNDRWLMNTNPELLAALSGGV